MRKTHTQIVKPETKYSNRVARAAQLIAEAESILQEAARDARGEKLWPLHGSLADFAGSISCVLETDHGDAGIVPFIKLLKKSGK